MSPPAASPSDAEITGGLIHGLLHAFCLGSATKEATARDQIHDHLQHPSLGRARGEALFQCATTYTAHSLGMSLSRLKIPPDGWEFPSEGDTYRESEAGHEQAKAAAVALMRRGNYGGSARDVLRRAAAIKALPEQPVVAESTGESIAAAESLVVEAVWLAVLASSSSAISRKQ